MINKNNTFPGYPGTSNLRKGLRTEAELMGKSWRESQGKSVQIFWKIWATDLFKPRGNQWPLIQTAD